jgi:hypothetical protein
MIFVPIISDFKLSAIGLERGSQELLKTGLKLLEGALVML